MSSDELLFAEKALLKRIEDMEEAINVSFLILTSILIFLMQAGFAFLEAGSIRAKNTTNILVKNTVDTTLGCIVYWCTGYAFGFGGDGNQFIGYNKFFLINTDADEYDFYFYNFVFAATAATIVSGAIAERARLSAYFLFVICMTGFIYPVVTHWVWSPNGWLKNLGYIDFAGSSVVHCIGGAASIVGATMAGPRRGRFENGRVMPIPGHSTVLVTLGYFILIFGFFAFNGASEKGIAGDNFSPENVARAVVNTSLAGSGGFLSAMFILKIAVKKVEMKAFGKEFQVLTLFGGYWSIVGSINGSIAGFAAICASCFGVEPWAGFVIGVVAGGVYCIGVRILLILKIDDPLQAGAVHLGGGVWGTLAAGIFLHHDRLDTLKNGGILYGWDADAFIAFGIQCIGVTVIIAWTAFFATLIFGFLRITGWLRVSAESEEDGLDYINGEPAYPIDPALLLNGSKDLSATSEYDTN